MKKLLFLIFAIIVMVISACKNSHHNDFDVQQKDTVKTQIIETTVSISEERSTEENVMIVVACIAIVVFVIFTIKLFCNLEPNSYSTEDADTYWDTVNANANNRKTCIIVMVLTALAATVLLLAVFA